MNPAVPPTPPPHNPEQPEHPGRAEATFNSALERPTAEREAYIAQACGDDTVLIAEVRGLLAAHEGAGEFMKTGAVRVPQAEQEGERIGRYKLLQQIGEGGFGSVWMAEQVEPVSRRVALKIIKLGMDTREVIARFEAERQALAMMDHPNIAKVLDAGATDKGRPFFVMELVKGMPITAYCDEAQLGTRERLALFGDVCAAINHAHQKGVIHRDIKPSNVMVTLHGDKPVVKVIDFGIAKAIHSRLTDKTLFTRFEQFIGTPVYMSPEQASVSGLDIDTRSDIYALGILLYELLTGKPPFDARTLASAGYEEMRRIIREVEPPKPSSRLSTVAGEERSTLAKSHRIEPSRLVRLVEPDLDWIVMKAIEKDRARRYETANGLAQDIVRFLADEPVSATPPSAGYRFRKFARRNRAALRVAAMIAAVLVAATIVSTWQAVRATRAEKQTADTLRQVAAERDAKEKARTDAVAISQFLTEVFQSPDPERDGRTVTVAELLDKASRKLDTDLTSQAASRARLQNTLGKTYMALGLLRPAAPLLEKARDHHLATLGPDHPDTLAVMNSLAACYANVGRLDESFKLLDEVLQRSKKLGDTHEHTLTAMTNLATIHFDFGRREVALKLREEAVALRREVNGPEHRETLAAMHNLALSYMDLHRHEEALKLCEEVFTLSRKVCGAEHPDTLSAMHNLAHSYTEAGRRDEALKLNEESVALSRKVLGPEHPETLSSMNNLAIGLADAGRKDEALKLREETLTLRRKVNGPAHPDTLRAILNLARSYHDGGRKDEALKLNEEAVALSRKFIGLENPDTLATMFILANALSAAGRAEEALTLREETLPLSRKVFGSDHPRTLMAMINLASSYSKARRHQEAFQLREEALMHNRRKLGPEHPDTLKAMTSLAQALKNLGETEKAKALENEVAAAKAKTAPGRK